MFEDDHLVYIHLEADNPQLFKWIPKSYEKFYSLHHLVMRDALHGLILIGNGPKIMFSVFVHSNNTIMEANHVILNAFYERRYYGLTNQLKNYQLKQSKAC